ncbi:MAG: LysE family translocator [Thermomicrobiales bacterium]
MDWVPAAMTGLAIGFAFTAVPGPVTTEATRRSVQGGFWPGFLVNAGSLIGDVVWAVLGLSGAAVLLQHDAFAVTLGLIGVGFLFALARDAMRACWNPVREDADSGGARSQGSALKVGAVFSLANPSGIAFWSGVGSGMLAGLGNASVGTIVVLIAAYLLAGMLLGSAFVAIAVLGSRLAGDRIMRWVDLVSGVALGSFGIRLLWTTVKRANPWLRPALRALL